MNNSEMVMAIGLLSSNVLNSQSDAEVIKNTKDIIVQNLQSTREDFNNNTVFYTLEIINLVKELLSSRILDVEEDAEIISLAKDTICKCVSVIKESNEPVTL